MAVAVSFGHSWASAVFYNFSAMRYPDDDSEPVDWDALSDYKKSFPEKAKRESVVSFDVDGSTISLIRKGKSEMIRPLSDVLSCTLDPHHPHFVRFEFKPLVGKKGASKKAKEDETLRIELCNKFDRVLIKELVDHALANDGSIKDLGDSFPKQTLHHSAVQIKQKSSFESKYAVLVKWKLYIYDDWYSKFTSGSLSVMGLEVVKDPKQKKVLELRTYPVPTYIKCGSEQERDFWHDMLFEAAAMDVGDAPNEGMDWDEFNAILDKVYENDPDLLELDFTDPKMHLSEEQAFMMAEALMSPNEVVQKLDLSSNLLLGNDGSQAISELLLDNLSSTKELILAGCGLGDDRADHFTEALKENTSCESIDLSYNHLTDDFTPLLSEMLEKNTTLRDLDLTGNDFTDDTFEIISDSLKANKGLTTLSLCAVKVTDAGIGHLAAGLKENSTLQELHLENVDISEAGRAALTEMLTVNKTVEIITNAEPAIVRPPPPPTAEPEPEPEPKPRRKKKKRTVFVAPPAEPVDDTPEFLKVKLKKSDINYVGSGKLDDVDADDGGGFLGALAMFRAREVKDERQAELDKLDPKDRDKKWKEWEEEDASKGVKIGAVKAAAKVAEKSAVFGVAANSLPTCKAEDGSVVPIVLTIMKKWITDHNGLAAADLFTKGAKGEKYVTARLSLNDVQAASTACDDPYIAALLMFDFFREQPNGGLLAGLPSTVLDAMDDEEGALALLGELDEVMQESLTFVVDVICENIKASGAEADAIAEVMAQAIAPAPSEDHAMLFTYSLIEYWKENT